ncbi:MAG: AsmA-like C-terminal region-containing protein, partial [Akkermansiaceae bacterium]|nr:AsmA-like C-terminal region-containing protein [Akkermansiaceae bacterium]
LLPGVLGAAFTKDEAQNASATFAIENGVAHTGDFFTSTPSTFCTGEGRINLDEKSLEMTVRMNARGLLGLVTLPLRPFNGLFQFHGEGLLKKPTWKSAPFTAPARGEDDPIFHPPRARIVNP